MLCQDRVERSAEQRGWDQIRGSMEQFTNTLPPYIWFISISHIVGSATHENDQVWFILSNILVHKVCLLFPIHSSILNALMRNV